MDAVELPFPAVAVSKLLTAEGFSRAGVSTVEEANARKADSVSILGSSPINGCISSCSPNDVMCVGITSEQDSVSRHRKAEVGLGRDEKQHSNFQGEKIIKLCGNVNSSVVMLPKSAGKQCTRKAGKVQSTSPCSKRQRTDQLEDTINQNGTVDSNVMSEKLGSGQAKCTFAEKSKVVKQKHDAKRVKAKTKLDPFFAKAGLLSSSSAIGGNNILGIYGLKSDIHDVTKHVDELSLNELLDGSYKCPSLCQDKGKKAANTNDNILHSVRKACSILQRRRPVQSQNSFELDSSSNKKAPTWLVTSGSCGTSMNCDKVDTNMTDLSSSSKIQASCGNPGASVNMNNSSLFQPKDILKQLELPPAKGLDSLLLEVVKPAVSSRSSIDLRSGKLTSKRAGLPPFSWSHSIGLPCKTNADVGKMCTTKSTCQGRWVRIGSAVSSLGDACGCFSDLDLLTYDHSLVPSRGLKLGLPEDEKVPLVHIKPPWHEPSSSTARFHPASHIPDVHSPRLLAAAQILCEIANDFWKRNQSNGKIRWPKKPSQKAMKARRSKYSTGKAEVLSVAEKSVTGSGDLAKVADQITLPKPPKFHRADEKKDLGYTNNLGRGLIKCSVPASRISSPSKLERDQVADSKLLNTDMVNLLGTKPFSTRILEECNSHQKTRKPLTVDWGRGRCKKE
ncbi:uncharacterized protein LOC122664552 isoform X2 [Telopea speciosissima]|uniref:uncharacterized protein LOC122664552 isoform X2 n=1 Tax=Telopea speciosissima TaxID=54955 RepID=UPI001CC3B896|nr:uncharacterized protein LOC122664552 isoform X2 [Telopea speciosissima]